MSNPQSRGSPRFWCTNIANHRAHISNRLHMFAPDSPACGHNTSTGKLMWQTECHYSQRVFTTEEVDANSADALLIRESCRRTMSQGVVVGSKIDSKNLLRVDEGKSSKTIPIADLQAARVQDLVDTVLEAPVWVDISTNRDDVYLDTMSKHVDKLITMVPFGYELKDVMGNIKRVTLDPAQREAILEKAMPLDRDVYAQATIHGDALVSQGKEASKIKRLTASNQILKGTKSAARVEILTPGSGKSPISCFAFFLQCAYPTMTPEQLRVQAVTTRAHHHTGLMPYVEGNIAPVMGAYCPPLHCACWLSAERRACACACACACAVVFCRGHLVQHWLREATAVAEECSNFYNMGARVWDGGPGKQRNLRRAQEENIPTIWVMEATTRNCNQALCEHETVAYQHLTIDEGVIEPHDPLRKSSPYVQMTVLLATPETINYCKLDEKNPM